MRKAAILTLIAALTGLLAAYVPVLAQEDDPPIGGEHNRNPDFQWEETLEPEENAFGQPVFIKYEAVNEHTVRHLPQGNVSWTLIQHGTADIWVCDEPNWVPSPSECKAVGEYLGDYSFQVQERARADDASDCPDGYWLGACDTGELPFFSYRWDIDGGSITHVWLVWNGSVFTREELYPHGNR